MSPDTISEFLSGYIHGLKEETKDVKGKSKYGFDHIILKLAEADNLIPVRLAYHLGGRTGPPKPKKEHEYGEDLKVIDPAGKQLTIFVLKDEPLTYRNWQEAGFNKDVSYAQQQDLSATEYSAVTEVRIVVAYNKGDEARGVEAYERAINSAPSKIGDHAKLTFERWNLTKLTNLVKEKLIGSPALLPEKLFRSFSYICWQVQDFTHGSEQWCEVLVPAWRKFLSELLHDSAKEQEIRLLSVALIIVFGHGKKEAAWETAWVEILEWSMVALWRLVRAQKSESTYEVTYIMWTNFYICELHSYYTRNKDILCTEDSISINSQGRLANAIAAHHAYWHLGRLGILSSHYLYLAGAIQSEDPEYAKGLFELSGMHISTLFGMIEANPACLRPMLDAHHVQLFLVWVLFKAADREEVAIDILAKMHARLIVRRQGGNGVRLIDQRNEWSHLLEHIATEQQPDESFGKSSYLLQMLIEICACGLGQAGESIAWAYYSHLILGQDDSGRSMNFPEVVELQSWIPPAGWIDKILTGPVLNEGVCITVDYQLSARNITGFATEVKRFIKGVRSEHPPEDMIGVPFGVVVLACLVHKSPLPPEFWRALFPDVSENKMPDTI